MTVNWVFWKSRDRYGEYVTNISLTRTVETSDYIPVSIKVKIVTEHTMGYEVEAVEIVSGGEHFVESVRERILKSVPSFLEVGKVKIDEN